MTLRFLGNLQPLFMSLPSSVLDVHYRILIIAGIGVTASEGNNGVSLLLEMRKPIHLNHHKKLLHRMTQIWETTNLPIAMIA